MAKATQKGNSKNFIGALMSLGRGTDNTIGHLTEGEVVIPRNVIDAEPGVLTPFIRAMTKHGMDWRPFVVGQGRVNPRTGVEEFRSVSFGGRDVEVGGWADGGSRSAPGQGVGRESSRNDSLDMLGSRPQSSSGGGTVSVAGQNVTPGAWAGGSPTYAEGGPMGSAGSRPGGPAAVGETSTFAQMLQDAFSSPSSRTPGFLGTAFGLAPGIGTLMGLTSIMQNVFGVPGVVDWEPGNPNPNARESGLNLDHRSQASQQIRQIANAAVAAGLIDPPAWLRRATEGMSPLQQRAHIATQGVAGTGGSYRSRDAFDYYRGLLTNTQYENVLPVEHQFLKDIWGANYGTNTSSLMRALAAI